MTNKPWFRNLRIGIMLTICYLTGMVAAYYATEALRLLRSDAPVEVSQEVARVPSETP
jgi:hypothetical protein